MSKKLHPLAEVALGVAAEVGGKAAKRALQEGAAGFMESVLEDTDGALSEASRRTKRAREKLSNLRGRAATEAEMPKDKVEEEEEETADEEEEEEADEDADEDDDEADEAADDDSVFDLQDLQDAEHFIREAIGIFKDPRAGSSSKVRFPPKHLKKLEEIQEWIWDEIDKLNFD